MRNKRTTLALMMAAGFWLGACGRQETGYLNAIPQHLLPLENSKPRDEGVAVDTILIHFCSDVVERPGAPYDADRIFKGFAAAGVSAHYLIDRTGQVVQWVELDRAAYHAGKGIVPWDPSRTNRLNEFSVGIELMGIGTKEEMAIYLDGEAYERLAPSMIGYTDAQYVALRKLVEALRERFPAIKHDDQHIYGHADYAPGRKTDPGTLFDWSKIGIERWSWK